MDDKAHTAVPELARVRAELRLRFARAGRRTEIDRVYETGGWRWRFPRAGEVAEAVVVNTGGGMAGGDRATVAIEVGPGARATVTSQSQEKIYRAEALGATLETRLTVGADASLFYAPQETLLFDRARLRRRLEADVAAGATLTVFEAACFGRLAHGETCIDASLVDDWRLRCDGKLVFAEALRLTSAGAALDRPAVGAGARAIATLVRIGPDAAERLDPLRETLVAAEAHGGLEAGASLVAGVLVARIAAVSPQRLREALVEIWRLFEGGDAPRVWR